MPIVGRDMPKLGLILSDQDRMFASLFMVRAWTEGREEAALGEERQKPGNSCWVGAEEKDRRERRHELPDRQESMRSRTGVSRKE
jgi:hypothetical protein